MMPVVPSLILSQVQEKKDLMQTLNKVPPPQASVRDTYGNATRDESAGTPKYAVENRSNPSISNFKVLRIRSKRRLVSSLRSTLTMMTVDSWQKFYTSAAF
jgi:hypothetical protein